MSPLCGTSSEQGLVRAITRRSKNKLTAPHTLTSALCSAMASLFCISPTRMFILHYVNFVYIQKLKLIVMQRWLPVYLTPALFGRMYVC